MQQMQSDGGTAAQFEEVAARLKPVAEAGDAVAQRVMFSCSFALATCYSSGAQAAHWRAESMRWLRASVALKDPGALHYLGMMTWTGNSQMGVACDRAEAARLFAEADAAGLPEEQRGYRAILMSLR
jgi:TPR repeat protein